MKLSLRRLRGALGTALTWAAAWFGAGFLFITLNHVLGLIPFRVYTELFLSNALRYATQMALVGFVTGGTFSLYVASTFRRERLEDLSPGRFALGGALVAVLLSLGLLGVSPGYGVLLLRDLGVPLGMAAVLGGGTSYASIKLAQRELPGPRRGEAELTSGTDNLLPRSTDAF
jgi:hypothetical protein